MSELTALEEWAGALLAKLEPKERRRINQSIARDLRRSQQQRIRKQQNPDGTPFAPRKKQPQRSKKGRIKRAAMFGKLQQARRLKMLSTADAISVGFMARNARIARVHQYGLRDRPGPKQKDVQYSRRELLGFSPADLKLIEDKLIEHLTRQ
jgi:phage virion morphogenesis protein